MSKKIDELLAVLDMSEEEQLAFLNDYPNKTIDGHKVMVRGNWRLTKKHLPALAFRLRDETIAKDDESPVDCWWCEASYEVYLYIIGEGNEMDAKEGLDTWFSMRAQPIHFIIASLIAKENNG